MNFWWVNHKWRVDIDFQRFTDPILPTQHMRAIAPTLPERYSPIRPSGHGNQGVYLAQIPRPMALLTPAPGRAISKTPLGVSESSPGSGAPSRRHPGYRRQEFIFPSPPLWRRGGRGEEAFDAPRLSSRTLTHHLQGCGQGLFRQNVAHLERFCRVTRVDRPEHLIASHIKPGRESDNRERLLEGNGLLLKRNTLSASTGERAGVRCRDLSRLDSGFSRRGLTTCSTVALFPLQTPANC